MSLRKANIKVFEYSSQVNRYHQGKTNIIEYYNNYQE